MFISPIKYVSSNNSLTRIRSLTISKPSGVARYTLPQHILCSNTSPNMAEKKRKERGDANNRHTGKKKSKKTSDNQRKKTGPRLPSSLKKEIQHLNPTPVDVDEIDSDVYEYEEEQPEEESRKNKRYDPVSVNDNNDLSSDFEVSYNCCTICS